jgi:hypothetical protein
VTLSSFEGLIDVIGRFTQSDDPLGDIDVALAELVEQFASRFQRLDPAQVIEVARMACLPWSFAGPVQAGAQTGGSTPGRIERRFARYAYQAVDSSRPLKSCGYPFVTNAPGDSGQAKRPMALR